MIKKLFSKDYWIIKRSGLFDTEYYLRTYPDVREADIDPMWHYCAYGWREGRNPSGRFDTGYYLSTYQDVYGAGVNPLAHYARYGRKEGRLTGKNTEQVVIKESYFTRRKKTIWKIARLIKMDPEFLLDVVSDIKKIGFSYAKRNIQARMHKEFVLSCEKVAVRGNGYNCNLNDIFKMINEKPFSIKIGSNKPIDLIIPIYNGYDYLEPLFSSIIRNTLTMRYRMIIINDCSPDKRVKQYLDDFVNKHPENNVLILENSENLGFIKSVNKAVGFTKNHFVLLNTDIEVPPFWLERMIYPIEHMDNIASVTPFTNSGTICSFPEYLKDNPIFEGLDYSYIDSFFAKVNLENTYIEMPTGVGYCMSINRDVFKKIGMFDEVFGKGYGEENDWCMRAIEIGYKNIIATNLFVYHKHGGSFQCEEKSMLMAINSQILESRHPTYHADVQKLISDNSLNFLRNTLVMLISASKLENDASTLIIDHALGGGANIYRNEKITKLLAANKKIFLLTYSVGEKIYKLKYMYKTYNIDFDCNLLTDVFNLFSEMLLLDTIFINCLVSYPNVKEIIDLVISCSSKTGAKVDYALHDYFCICPSYTLLNNNITYCGVPDNLNICIDCLSHHAGEFKIFSNEVNVREWRHKWTALLTFCSSILVFSYSSQEILLRVYPMLFNKITIQYHSLPYTYKSIYKYINNTDEIRIGVLGAINEAKGALFLDRLVKYIDKHKLNAKVVLFGECSLRIISESFEVLGRYRHAELPDLILNKQITQFLIPSICPETFSYTTEEIMQMGYPIVVFDIGAPAERVRNYPLGKIVKVDDVEGVLFF